MTKIQTSIVCQPCLEKLKTSWTKLMFRSQANEGIANLVVTIKDLTGVPVTKITDSEGLVHFENIVKAEINFTVSTDSLLNEVEKYASAKVIKNFMPHSEITFDDIPQNFTLHRKVNLADLWDEEPEDKVIVKMHPRISLVTNKVWPECVTIFEVNPLRCHVPVFYNSDTYNLVSSYNSSLLAILSYADYFKDIIDDAKTYNTEKIIEAIDRNPTYLSDVIEHNLEEKASQPCKAGTVIDVLTRLRMGKHVNMLNKSNIFDYPHILDELAPFIIEERPYSHHFKGIPVIETTPIEILESSEAFLWWNNDTVIISFRGTQEIINDGLIIDANALHKNINLDGSDSKANNTYEVHAGFYNYVNVLYPLLKYKVDQLLQEKSRHVIVCGHSLGGASASLFSLYLDNLVFEFDEETPFKSKMLSHRTFTFGAPRVFTATEEMMDKVQNLVHFRHVNHRDVVPIVPPQTLGFQHQGILVQLISYVNANKTTDYATLLPHISSLAKDDGFVGMDINPLTIFGGSYHSSVAYAKNIAHQIADFYEYDVSLEQRREMIVKTLKAERDKLKQHTLIKRGWYPDRTTQNLPQGREVIQIRHTIDQLNLGIRLLTEPNKVKQKVDEHLESCCILYGDIKPSDFVISQLEHWKIFNKQNT